MTLTDLKTTYNVLCELDYPVPTDLLVHLAERIRATEARNAERKLARMTEEQLIRLSSKPKRRLKIYTADGRMIQKDTAEATFREAIRELDAEILAEMDLRIGRKQLILRDETLARKRISGYVFLRPGYFLIASSTSAAKYDVLRKIDAQLQLNWDIELV